MLIALLAVLGVDLIVIVVLIACLTGRRRWVKRQDGAFRGTIRAESGQLDGLGAKWRRGYGQGPQRPRLDQSTAAPQQPDHGRRRRGRGARRESGAGQAPWRRAGRGDSGISGATAEVATRREHRELLLALDRKPLSVR
jgi:hypothetical protein